MTAIILVFIAIMFYILLLSYSILTFYGIRFRAQEKHRVPLDKYPSVAIFIPAHNEGKVIEATLEAMSKLTYPGELEIFLLNDSSSDDTAEIAQFFDEIYPHIHHIKVPPGTPKGKSRVLNHGLTLTDAEYIAVYDADNEPEANALTLLVEAAVKTPKACGAVGYVKTINANKNMLTRMIALEFQVFQLIMQAGRWKLWQLGSLTGTNMLVKRESLLEVGKWDPYALAEDAELTLALTARGYLLPVVPESVTWEQEPKSSQCGFVSVQDG